MEQEMEADEAPGWNIWQIWGIWHTWQIWHMWANFQCYSQQRWTREHLKLATQLSSLSAASLQRHLLLSCSWWVFNFDTIFGQQQKNFRSVAILCRAREVALVRGESPTSLFFRSDISFCIENCHKKSQNNGCLSRNPIVCVGYIYVMYVPHTLLERHLITTIWWPLLNAPAGWLDSSCSWVFEKPTWITIWITFSDLHFHPAFKGLACIKGDNMNQFNYKPVRCSIPHHPTRRSIPLLTPYFISQFKTLFKTIEEFFLQVS